MIRSLALASLAAALTVTAFGVAPSAAAPPYPQCMTDDGYGRIRPCTVLYKRQHPNWRSGRECMTDDGYGRYRPCDSLYWQGAGSWSGQQPTPKK
jgi:hypothetical protein